MQKNVLLNNWNENLRQVFDIRAHLLIRQATGVPVEGGRLVIGQHKMWKHRFHVPGELDGLVVTGFPGLHPDNVRIQAEGFGPLAAKFDAAADAVITLGNSGVGN